MKTLVKIKNWIINHLPTRRRIIQLYTFLLYNANSKGYIQGQIYTGNSKYVCVPGMNCYSCPGAIGACPLGALQNALNASGTTTAYYMFGIIGLFGLICARTICGFLCPIGLGQELLYKIKTPKLKKSKVTRVISYLKYAILVVFVIAIPIVYAFLSTPMPGFCKYICPAGTFEGGIGLLLNPNNWPTGGLLDMLGPIFTWKFCVLMVIIVASVFIYRPFCRFICPLGAIYGFFNRISLIGVKLDKNKCTDCGLCIAHCKMDIKHVGDHECINCGECISVCPAKAISWKGSKIFLRNNEIDAPVAAEEISLASIKAMKFTPAASEAPADNSAEHVSDRTEQVGKINETPAEATVIKPAEGEHVSITPAEPASEAPAAEIKQEAPEKKTRKRGRNFWLQFTAWTLAVLLLLGLLIYYNAVDIDRQTYGIEVGDMIFNFDATKDGDAFKLADNLGKGSTILVVYDQSEESGTHLSNLQKSFTELKSDYPSYTSDTKLYALQAADGADNAQFAEQYGLKNGDITFIQDSEHGFISRLENASALPLTFTLDGNGIITSRIDGECDAESSTELIRDTYCKNEVGSLLYDFTVRKYGKNESGKFALLDETFTASDHLGEVLVINFWGTWCTPCVGELPHFNRLATEYLDKGVTVIAIHGKSNDNVARYIQNKDDWKDYNLIFAQDNLDGETCLTFELLGGVMTWPMTFIVDKEGKVAFIRQGSLTYEKLKAEVDAALA